VAGSSKEKGKAPAPSSPEIDADRCNGCGECVARCSTQAAGLVDGKAVIVHPEKCDYCTECEALCSAGAIRCPYEIVMADPEPIP
jgi:ferredoxin